MMLPSFINLKTIIKLKSFGHIQHFGISASQRNKLKSKRITSSDVHKDTLNQTTFQDIKD